LLPQSQFLPFRLTFHRLANVLRRMAWQSGQRVWWLV